MDKRRNTWKKHRAKVFLDMAEDIPPITKEIIKGTINAPIKDNLPTNKYTNQTKADEKA